MILWPVTIKIKRIRDVFNATNNNYKFLLKMIIKLLSKSVCNLWK
jgi:hypothetical protein